jgi:hypothetical protein
MRPVRTCLVAGLAAASAVSVAAADTDFFERHIRPVLVERCYECHSGAAQQVKGGFHLDSREGLLRGGDSGRPAIVPGDAERSPLIAAIRHADPDLKMPPPRHGAQLTKDQIAAFVAWVNAGAPDPRDAGSSKPGTQASNKSADHWAFLPPRPQRVPAVKDRDWPQTPIDAFILAKLEANGLRPSPPADVRTLIRRMTFDVTGLPPTFAEVEAFVREAKDDRRSATARLIERLLASPHHGERWARHWLDVARYSDTKGYVYGREERFFVHAWAYRDWVVRALNDDLPYDRFLMLQIAADQLVPPRAPDLAAMGFLTGGRRFIGVTRDIIDDRIDVVTRGTMALTVQCARCHDHKYDPIPTADYYSLYGVFHNANERLVRLDADERTAVDPAFEKEYQARLDKLNETMAQRRAEATERLRTRVGDYLAAQLELHEYPEEGFDQILTAGDLIPASVRQWRDFLKQSKAGVHPIFAPWHVLAELPDKLFAKETGRALARLSLDHGNRLNTRVTAAFVTPPQSMQEVARRYGELFKTVDKAWQEAVSEAKKASLPVPEAMVEPADEQLRRFLYEPDSPTTVPDVGIVDNEWFFPTSVCEELWKLQKQVDQWLIESKASLAFARVMEDAKPEPPPRIFLRGNPATKGREVPRQFLEVIDGPDRRPFQHGSGRLELARAIATPDNPLTARVMVNRLWQHHFGEGLVRTPSDFGLRAELPSHPELLDWLALRFIEEGWSLKAIHRLILGSAVYQQSSSSTRHAERWARNVQAADRDAPVSRSALRTPHSIDPANRLLWRFNRQRLDFEQMRDALLAVSGEMRPALGGKPVPMLGDDNRRRSLYGLVDRQFLPPLFRAFDFANPDLHIPQRHETTVSQQALFFLNHPWVAARAKQLAGNPDAAASPGASARVHAIYHRLFQREPASHEVESALRFLADAEAHQPPPPPKPVPSAWQYGWGAYDEVAQRTKGFRPLPHFTGEAWQGGEKWPDAKLGWVQLTATGGHPGNDLEHASIRRWTAPVDATVSIAGTLVNEPEAGDGIRGFIVSSRLGELKSGEAHRSKTGMSVDAVEVRAGDTIDFIVDIKKVLNSDQFLWAPVITVTKATSATGHEARPLAKAWDAQKEFAGPTPPYEPPLTPWEQYVQVLLLSNEFMFVD